MDIWQWIGVVVLAALYGWATYYIGWVEGRRHGEAEVEKECDRWLAKTAKRRGN